MAFNRDNRSGGGPASRQGGRGFGRGSFGGDPGGDRQMFKATCSNCGKECEVPFKPTGSKPVYCRDCFRTMGGSDSRRTDNRGSRKPNFDNGGRGSAQPQYREQFEALNVKLDKILTILTPVAFGEKAPVIQEEKIVKEVEVLQLEEQAVIPEKKKRVSKKVPLTPEEQL